ncbi:putative procollagen-proline 4-dioxygenase [Helianthus annuus]|uniref:Procollagen-proline 4-dioxygenase n=1 Tax=Helianthus annuus TaxID=4232 RepID=A0A251U5D7_HELAN|nr:probable prolyl 4-hydroxylase 7 isoform X1 [Helianthus annuus]XP_021977468.1 probable prolyl 4-hydroxylase 7 isoform X1 [Helianthus annuus]KAF5795379.1 putative procollagen-proline 4-dioxygenase [Helianthus annuus]KAJ0706550.1 putative procollagen-proline 4-dioxygenase [Helianthus annuus]KAJ0722435.1 putative procollagen-proline 4-dioxygenase [Helianthus annuus]KAJ0887119.1 putative procollagen-proline 4-dioxygenase [Helianthus annuus]
MITIRSMLRGVLHSERMNLFMAKAKLEKSMVADNESGKSIQSEVRTSSGMFLNKAQIQGEGMLYVWWQRSSYEIQDL